MPKKLTSPFLKRRSIKLGLLSLHFSNFQKLIEHPMTIEKNPFFKLSQRVGNVGVVF